MKGRHQRARVPRRGHDRVRRLAGRGPRRGGRNALTIGVLGLVAVTMASGALRLQSQAAPTDASGPGEPPADAVPAPPSAVPRPPTAPPRRPPAAPSPSQSAPPPGGTSPYPPPHARTAWLYQLVDHVDATGPSGVRRTATLRGETSTRSTSFWVACDGDRAITSFKLDGSYGRLTAVLALDRHTPPDLRVLVVLRDREDTLVRRTLTRGRTGAVDLSTKGVRTLTLAATVVDGRCGSAPVGYGIAFDARLRAAG